MSAERTDAPDRALVGAAWRALFDFFIRTRGQRDRALAKLGLTPNDAKALGTLDPKDGVRMSALAAAWSTDPPNATWVITRLEGRGLVERRAHPADRRVKLVVLTAKGRDVRAKLTQAMYEPPPQLDRLSARELEALCAILEKAIAR